MKPTRDQLITALTHARDAAEAYRDRFGGPRGLIGPIDPYMEELERALAGVGMLRPESKPERVTQG